MSEGLSGKVSIITGACSGLGLATAIMFAHRGAMITLCGRDQVRLKAAVQDQCIQTSGGHADRFITVSGDLNDRKVREEIVAKTVQKFGRLDILVANAGVVIPATITDATDTTFDTIFNTNVKSVFFLIQQALSHPEKAKGNIVSTSSDRSTLVHPHSSVYSMIKAALNHLTRYLALDLGPKGYASILSTPRSPAPKLLGVWTQTWTKSTNRRHGDAPAANGRVWNTGRRGSSMEVNTGERTTVRRRGQAVRSRCLGRDAMTWVKTTG